ncbi:MAG: hypothetical protein AMS26_19680 [Bacteroides sp. SM23_62]|nr:MAG: hypothetical protein AMS26_19680 [Bacteroides sp. SM23_62]
MLDIRIIKFIYFTKIFLSALHTKRNVNLKTKKTTNYESDFVSIERLLKAMRYDPVINKKVVNILKMDSYPRRIVLSNWLEQLSRNNAPKKLTQILSYLFEDEFAERILMLLQKRIKSY